MASSLGNAVGVFGGLKKNREGRNMQKKAQRFIDDFEYSDLQNSFDGVAPSTLGAELQRDELARGLSTSVDALRSGGIRGVLGGLGRINMQNQYANRMVAADLDRQQKQIDFARAQDQSNIRAMEERRQAEELAGYGQMLNVGMQMKYGGIADIMNAGQAQGQTNQSIMSSIMGGMSGGMMGGGSQAPAPSVGYGTGMNF